MKQRTLSREVTMKGTALHTGDVVTLTFKPAPAGHGVVFRRLDLPGHPTVRPTLDRITDTQRATTITDGAAQVHTVEHVLSACHGLGVDNVLVELDGSEPPIADGSALPFVSLLQQGEPVEQAAGREYFTLTDPVAVTRGNASLVALPHDGLRITCTSADDRGFHTQHLVLDIDPDVYAAQVAAARTFTIYEDIEELLRLGKIRGGSLENAIVIRGGEVLAKDGLRFRDEFVRHKILDLVGDLLLLGRPLKAHLVATRPGHAINAELGRALLVRFAARTVRPAPRVVLAHESMLDIRRVLDLIPHRFPFVMIDRVLAFRGDDELTAIKNVTFNEPYFQGHFPGIPVMPGVLQVEAMAQAAGILMIRRLGKETQLAFFMSADAVKFRRAVRPGDQLVIDVRLTKTRGNRIGVAEGTCRVDGQIVSSAELMFSLVDSFEET